jgi:transcriptional regulator with XRE-family HTH domain
MSTYMKNKWPGIRVSPSIPPTMVGNEQTGTQDVAARLKQTREALKLSQARLCRISDISPSAWNNYETADARIGVDQAIKLCQATGVTLDWIYRGVRAGLPNAILEALTQLERERRLSGIKKS